MKHYQVIIIGGGATGLALAVTLGQRGVSCLLLESRTTISRIPKGQNLTHRTAEHFYFWGLIEELRAARITPHDFSIGELTAYSDLMSPYWHAPVGREVLGPYFFQANDRMPQYQSEGVLRRGLSTLPKVDCRFGWTATTVTQDENVARVTIAEVEGAGCEVLGADYVVGCDGGHSLVRTQMGVERRGTDFDQLMVLMVFRSRELSERLKHLPERSFYRVMHPDLKGFWQFFGRVDVNEGWFFHAPVPSNTTKEKFDFMGALERATGFSFACDFDHVGFWDLRTAVAERYRVGRVFIAGDAAHSHPPYGGFGLNNGLEDAVNLGWKLAATIEGWGGDALLQSYDEERRPVFEDIAQNFIAGRIANDAAFLAAYNPDCDREAFEREWKRRENDISSRFKAYETNYEGSSVIVGPLGGVSSAHGTYMLAARAGHHLAPQALSSGRNVFEELGRDFTLLAFDADDADVASFKHGAACHGVSLTVVRDSYREGRAAYASRLVLVRPDQFIAWTGDRAPSDTLALMAKATGQGTPCRSTTASVPAHDVSQLLK